MECDFAKYFLLFRPLGSFRANSTVFTGIMGDVPIEGEFTRAVTYGGVAAHSPHLFWRH